MFGWLGNSKSHQKRSWNNQLTIPRELYKNEKLFKNLLKKLKT